MDNDEGFIEVVDIGIDKPKIYLKKESMGSEKQISVDPISLREQSSQLQMVDVVSQSLLNSASTSPKIPTKTSKNHSIALANIHRLSAIHLQRSKSCGEGRASAPPDDFDLWVTDKPVNVQNKRNDGDYTSHNNNNKYSMIIEQADDNVTSVEDGTDTVAEKFKCKALCLYLPAFGKAKPIRARRQSSDVSQAKESETGHVVSKRVSLEKFECASLDSSGFINDDDEDASSLFFDLPLELIKFSINDTDSPVTTAFVFDKEPKGVLKKTTAKSTDSSARQVRFSTSSPTFSVTPASHYSQHDFSVFMEAHNA